MLTPHTYFLNGAVTFTDSLYLNALGNNDAVFVIQINGALSTSTYSKVKLINGAQAHNVYWKIEGAVSINNYSVFCGTIICNNGALGAINTGVELNGRALTTSGALTITAANVVAPLIPSFCSGVSVPSTVLASDAVLIYPNPFNTYTTLRLNDLLMINNAELKIYNILGKELKYTIIVNSETTIKMSDFPSGIYYYEVISRGSIVQSGKLISQ